jgi:hypothetical protein
MNRPTQKLYGWRVLIFTAFISLFPAGMVRAGESVILEVIINGYNAGQHFLILTADDDVLVSAEFLTGLRLRGELWTGKGPENISLRGLSPGLKFQVDKNYATLTMAAAPEWFEPQQISRPAPPPNPMTTTDNILSASPFSGFFNYQVQALYTEKDGVNEYQLPTEIGTNYRDWLAFSNFYTRWNESENTFSKNAELDHRRFQRAGNCPFRWRDIRRHFVGYPVFTGS